MISARLIQRSDKIVIAKDLAEGRGRNHESGCHKDASRPEHSADLSKRSLRIGPTVDGCPCMSPRCAQ